MGEQQLKTPSLPGGPSALAPGPQGCDPVGCYDNEAS